MLAANSMKLFSASGLAAAFSCAGVGITPGLTALTRIAFFERVPVEDFQFIPSGQGSLNGQSR
jgi:hypothetical protein